MPVNQKEENLVEFSILELKEAYDREFTLLEKKQILFHEVQDALLYLSKIESMQLEGGFFVLYNAMDIHRIQMDNRIKYKQDDYRKFDEYYKQRIQQIHIVGEYANMMVRNYDEALLFVSDYFQMDYQIFLNKYFSGERQMEINRNITPEKYRQLFDSLSETQRQIIDDSVSKNIVVAAGPGSGKTRVLVHKLASLMLLEDVKHEQLLMLTFSRSAATEFKQRLYNMIGNAASFLESKTFHSYCFDIAGKVGCIDNSENIVEVAAKMIRNGEVEQGKISKKVVVIDEAQDMDKYEFSLIEAMIEQNDDLHIIAVGDDDQNIYQFRGSDSSYMRKLIEVYDAKKYTLIENYRSDNDIVNFANKFIEQVSDRLKTEVIRPVTNKKGLVQIIKHIGNNMEKPIVNSIVTNKSTGTVCVLTNTNDEALRVTGLLKKENIHARLIQSNDGFNLYDLAELRMFMKYVNIDKNTPVISDDAWKKAIEKLKTKYEKSTCLGMCLKLLDTFMSAQRKLYKSDLEMFIRESQISDFCYQKKGEVIVSTIHKAKGREFDTVYMMLNNISIDTDEEIRKLYVGITRSKKELFIHINNNKLDNLCDKVIYDNQKYCEPTELMLQMTRKDVFLDYFCNPGMKEKVFRHQSGDRLYLKGKLLFESQNDSSGAIAVLSNAAKEKLDRLYAKGYWVSDVKIRFIVARKTETMETESAIILPDIYLCKNKRL